MLGKTDSETTQTVTTDHANAKGKYLLLLDINGAMCQRLTKRVKNRSSHDFKFKTYFVYRRQGLFKFMNYLEERTDLFDVFFYTSIMHHNSIGMVKRLFPDNNHLYITRILSRSMNKPRPQSKCTEEEKDSCRPSNVICSTVIFNNTKSNIEKNNPVTSTSDLRESNLAQKRHENGTDSYQHHIGDCKKIVDGNNAKTSSNEYWKKSIINKKSGKEKTTHRYLSDTVRDLNKVWKLISPHGPRTTIMVDNDSDKCYECKENAIIVPSFIDEQKLECKEDSMLEKLEKYLRQIEKVQPDDVREFLHDNPFDKFDSNESNGICVTKVGKDETVCHNLHDSKTNDPKRGEENILNIMNSVEKENEITTTKGIVVEQLENLSIGGM